MTATRKCQKSLLRHTRLRASPGAENFSYVTDNGIADSNVATVTFDIRKP